MLGVEAEAVALVEVNTLISWVREELFKDSVKGGRGMTCEQSDKNFLSQKWL